MGQDNLEPLWSSQGYSVFFGAKMPFVRYELYPTKLRIISGFFNQTIKEILLHRIVQREIQTTPVGRIFHCGKIKLITKDKRVADVYLSVKDPESVLEAIDNAKSQEQRDFIRKQRGQFSRRQCNRNV